MENGIFIWITNIMSIIGLLSFIILCFVCIVISLMILTKPKKVGWWMYVFRSKKYRKNVTIFIDRQNLKLAKQQLSLNKGNPAFYELVKEVHIKRVPFNMEIYNA